MPFSGAYFPVAGGFASLEGVPVGPFRLVGSEAIGEGVIETLEKYPKSPAVLMQNHGRNKRTFSGHNAAFLRLDKYCRHCIELMLTVKPMAT